MFKWLKDFLFGSAEERKPALKTTTTSMSLPTEKKRSGRPPGIKTRKTSRTVKK